MKSWIKNNLRNVIVISFIIPILLVAFVSISHVTSFYGISNPFSWAIYLSIAIEIAAISALAGLSVRMGNFIYIPFGIVTLIQFIGNIFFAFSYIDETSQIFKDWMEMAGSVLEPVGIEPTDVSSHKRILALFSGGMLPLISLTFAHMLVKFTDTFETVSNNKNEEINVEELSKQAGKIEANNQEERWIPTDEEIHKLEEILKKKFETNEPVYVSSEEVLQKLSEILTPVSEEIVEPRIEETTLEVTTTTENDVTTTSTSIVNPTTTTTVFGLDNLPKRLNYLSRDSNV